MFVRVAAPITGALLLAVAFGVERSAAASAASRIIDRTAVCRTVGVGYPDQVRVMNASARPFVAALGGAPAPPEIHVSNLSGGTAGVTAHFRAGEPDAYRPAISLGWSRCRPTPRFPLSSGGLRGGVTEPFGDSFRCDIPAAVVIRFRARFARPVALRRNPRFRDYLLARGNLVSAAIVVATLPGRRPLVFAAIDHESGQARLSVAPSRCAEE